MNTNPQSNPSLPARPRSRIVRNIVAAVLLSLAAIAVYSIYVAVHTPDPQETVILGQEKIASGSSAGLRIFVRNRISGKGIQGARLELSLLGKKTRAVKLGSFKTDSTGTLAGSISIPEIPPGEY